MKVQFFHKKTGLSTCKGVNEMVFLKHLRETNLIKTCDILCLVGVNLNKAYTL